MPVWPPSLPPGVPPPLLGPQAVSACCSRRTLLLRRRRSQGGGALGVCLGFAIPPSMALLPGLYDSCHTLLSGSDISMGCLGSELNSTRLF